MGRLSDRFIQQSTVFPSFWKRYLNARLVLAGLGVFCAFGSLVAASVAVYKASISESKIATPLVVQSADEALSLKNQKDALSSGESVALPPLRALNRTERNLADYLSRGYRVTFDHAARIVVHAIDLGKDHDVDPLLILSVVAVESSLNPKAQSSAGAQGLMQVHTRVHTDKFEEHGGAKAAFDPYANMDVGTQILKGYIARTGSVVRALKWYVGASRNKTDGGYGRRVLGEKSRITLAAQGQVSHAVSLLQRRALGPTYWPSRKARKSQFADYRKIERQGNRNRTSQSTVAHKIS